MRTPFNAPNRLGAPRVAALVSLAVALGLGSAAASPATPASATPSAPASAPATATAGEPDGPLPLPASTDALSLYSALDARARAMVDEQSRVVTFAHDQEDGGAVEMEAWSLGTILHPPAAVRAVLRQLADYPNWLILNPSYKAVRTSGAATLTCDVGRSSARRAQRTLTYTVRQDGATTTWDLVDTRTVFQEGSLLAYTVVPHPTLDGASLVVHRQVAALPSRGRLTRYLTSDNKSGDNRFWRDANRHARRTHWALAAAVRHPAGDDRRRLYLEHYQRDLGGVPFWAQ